MNVKKYIEEDIFEIISLAAKDLGVEAYVIGGYVRDCLLERERSIKDIDIVCNKSGIELAEKVSERLSNHPKVAVFKRFGTAAIHYKNIDLEFVGARKESYRADSRKPVVEDGTLEDDQNRRDFTINAMAISLNPKDYGQLIDPFEGQRHLVEKLIKTPLEPDVTYSDDPLRMMRAIRFASQLNFEIEKASFQSIKDNAERLKIISQERIMDEFNKIMLCAKPSVGLKKLYDSDLLIQILPEVCALAGVEEIEGQLHKDNFWHSLEVVDNISENTDNLWLRWAALLHDIGKAPTKRFDKKVGWTFHGHEFLGGKMIARIFKRLKLPLDAKMKYVQKMVVLSSRPIALISEDTSDSAIRRLLFDAGEDIDDLMTLCNADITTKNKRKLNRYKANFVLVRKKFKEIEEKDKLRNWEPPIGGGDIIKTFNIPPGPEIGVIKTAIREAILDGAIENDYDAAFEFMLKKGIEIGLSYER